MAINTLLRKTTGLNNVSDPVRLEYSFESGVGELSTAYNVDISDDGSVSRRKGFATTARTESSHSIFCEGGQCLFVNGTALFKLNADYSRTGLRSSMTSGLKMNYVQVNDSIYYTNGVEIGYITGDTAYVWYAKAYEGPTNFRKFSDPPVGTCLGYFNGRIYVGVGNTVWYSEPFAYGWFDMARSYTSFPGDVRTIRGVTNGLFVSDEYKTYFLEGNDPEKSILRIVDESPIIKGTDYPVETSRVKESGKGGKGIVWTSKTAICLGTEDGTVVNLTGKKLTFPSSNFGCGVVSNNKYICFLEE